MKQKAAKWIQRTHLFRKDEYECSCCGSRTDKPYIVCPGCGRPIKGSKYNAFWVDEIEAIDAVFDD